MNGIYSSLTRTDSRTANQGLVEQVRSKAHVVKSYIRSYRWAQQKTEHFQDVQHYCLFLGHARSGGSLLGGLLDAHPNVVIADEVDIFPYIEAGFEREQVFHLLLERSQRQANKGHVKGGRDAKQYSYSVPGAWQGRYKQLQVIGNRKAGITTQHLGSDPQALERLQILLGNINVKLIVSVRNPFDTISTMSIRSGRELESGLTQYFANCATIESIKNTVAPGTLLAVRHEELLHNPQSHLEQMCRFLELSAPESYLQACSAILYQSPSASRRKVAWSPEMIQKVQAQIEQYSFLEGYSYES